MADETKKKKNNWKLRANVSIEAKQNVKVTKSRLVLHGKDFNQQEVVDYMLKNYRDDTLTEKPVK